MEGRAMPIALKSSQALALLHDVGLAIVREGLPDLSPRQLTILLTHLSRNRPVIRYAALPRSSA